MNRRRIILIVLLFCILLPDPLVQGKSFQGLGISGTVYISGNGNIPFTSNSYYTASQGWQSFSGDFTAVSVTPDGSTFVGNAPVVATIYLFPDQPISFNTTAAATWTSQNGVYQLDSPPLALSDNSTATNIAANGSTIIGNLNGLMPSNAIYWTAGSEPVNYILEPVSYIYGYSALAVSANGNTIAGYGAGTDGVGGAGFNSKIKPYIWRADSGITPITEFDAEVPYKGMTPESPSEMHISDDGSKIIGSTVNKTFLWDELTGIEWIQADNYQNVYELTPYDATADCSIFVGLIGYEVHQDIGDGWTIISPRNETIIWDELNGIRNLKQVLQSEYGLEIGGWTLTSASGISDDGMTIVGTGINPQGVTEDWIAVIPEPATIILLIFGGLISRIKI